MCGLQPLAFEVNVEVGVLTGLNGLLGVTESADYLCYFIFLVLAWDPGLILVPIRLGLAGIDSSTPL